MMDDLAAAHVRKLGEAAAAGRGYAAAQLAQLAAKGEAARGAIREAGGVEGLLPLLHAASTQAEAAGALAALAVDAEARAMVREAGGCVLLAQTLRSKSAAAQEEAARALGLLACDEDGRVEIARLGGILALVELLRSNDRGMQLVAAGALNQLARNAENRVAIVGADGHDTMIEILRGGETPAPPRLQAQAAGTLANLAFYGPNKRKIREGGGVERLVGVLASESAEVACMAVTALSRLTKNDAQCQAAVSDADGVRQLAALLWSEDESARRHARATIENLGAHPEEEKEAWAKAKADERTGSAAKADKLREQADERLLVGELDAAAETYTEALALHPSSTLLKRRLARTERERDSASSSIERLAARTTSVRQTRRKLTSKAPDPLKLAGMPDGILSLIEQFRAVDSRRKRHGIAAHLAPSFTSARQQLDEATAQLDAAQSALYRRSAESTPEAILPPTSSSASRIGTSIGDGYPSFAVGKEDTLLPPDIKELIQRRDDARRYFVQAAETFLSRLGAEAFQESHEAVVHVIGPLQQAADQLGSVPILGPTALGEEAEALQKAEQPVVEDEYSDAKQLVPEAAALVAFDRWIAENTAATVGTKTEEAISQLLTCVSKSIGRSAPLEPAAQTDHTDDTITQMNQQEQLVEAVRNADDRLKIEERYWQLADPIRSLPVGEIRRSAGALLREFASQIKQVETIYSYAEMIEERRGAAIEWIEREDQGDAPGVTELVKYSDLAQECAEQMEDVTVTITRLRNEPEHTRDNYRLQEMESKAKDLRRHRYEAEKGLKAERKRLCKLAAEHYPELPLRFPGAGIRLDPPATSQPGQPAEPEGDHPKDVDDGTGDGDQLRALATELQGSGEAAGRQPSDWTGATRGLGEVLEAEAEALAKMRKRLMDAERKLSQSGALNEEEDTMQRLRRELLRRQRAFSLKCELAGRKDELSSPPRSVAAAPELTNSVPQGAVSLSDIFGGQAKRESQRKQERPEPRSERDSEHIATDNVATTASTRTLRRSGSTAAHQPRSPRHASPPRTKSSTPSATTSPTPAVSTIKVLSVPTSVENGASSPSATISTVTPTRAVTGQYSSAEQTPGEPRSLRVKRETLGFADSEGGLDNVRNATMKAAARRAEQHQHLQLESETSMRSNVRLQQATKATRSAGKAATTTADLVAPSKLTRLERARQEASARISNGEKLAAGGEAAEDTQRRQRRSPSPPRTLSSRMAAAQRRQAHSLGADFSKVAAGRSSSNTGSSAFRQPRTDSEMNAAPGPPPMGLTPSAVDEQPRAADSQAGSAAGGLLNTIATGDRETMGPSVSSILPHGTSSEAMEASRDGIVTRREYTRVEATMAYAEYSAGLASNNLRTASAASAVGWSVPPPASPMPTLSAVSEREELGSAQKTSSRMDLLAAARAKLERR